MWQSTLSRPSRKPSMIASRSRESFAPCKEATLCPSAVIRCEMRSAVCRYYVVFFKKLLALAKEGQNKTANLAENNALSNRQQLIQRDQDIIFVLLIPTIHVELFDALKT